MVALLTTEDFFVCNDTNYQNTSFYNPETLNTTYWLHHWGVYSVSPFVPAICFTTDAGTATGTATQTVSGLSITVDPAQIKAGETAQITAELQGTISGGNGAISVKPDAAIYTLSCEADNTAVQLGLDTYVDNYGVLHTQGDLPEDAVITIAAKATYINPSGATGTYTDTATVTITE